MTSPVFREHIRAAIADESLQAALDANAERRVQGRIAAFASLPDWQTRRQRARAVRAEVIAHLDAYIAAFSAKVAQNGIRVHRATDGAQAIGLVLGIAGAAQELRRQQDNAVRSDTAQTGPATLFAKSKSMVSEEIELNRALQARGHRVVETDLGEYIVQLRGEKPAHIITPAVHLRRHQVGELFKEKLGLPYTDDIPTLTAAARRVLREVFLAADIGISGVNFGVAESGTLCIVTNEGNGRMVTTMPPVHIALMGMERIVPTLDDLVLMLSLLPRSATGQKLSVYTQLIHSARREGEIDGALERHLIILDNGRSEVQASQLQESLYCIRCGACLNACPVFREIGGHAYVGSDGSPAPYPGPIGSVISPGLLGLKRFGHLAQASSLCGACKDACPVDIDLPKMLTRVRAGAPDRSSRRAGIGLSLLSRIGLQTYGAIGSSPRLFEVAQRLATFGARIISPASEWMRLPAITGWGSSKDFPHPAREPFRARWRGGGTPIEPPAAADHSPSPDSLRGEALRVIAAGGRGAVPEPAAVAVVDKFITELESLGASVRRTTAPELPAQLIALFHERALQSVLAWDEIGGLDTAHFAQAGLRLVRSADPSVKAGLTGCACAVAETGTLVLSSKAGQPLSASLLPEIHVAVVQKPQILSTLEEALQLDEVRRTSATVLITGPSRTADIEMTLTIGVHGPRELIVYIVE
jgi:L-lactate dehydrogenase complex protein LldF